MSNIVFKYRADKKHLASKLAQLLYKARKESGYITVFSNSLSKLRESISETEIKKFSKLMFSEYNKLFKLNKV